jgi:hypothetical protein
LDSELIIILTDDYLNLSVFILSDFTFLAENSCESLIAKAGSIIAKAPIGAIILAQFEIAILSGEAL